MKQFMLRSLMLLSVLLSSLGISDAWAQLVGGKVYCFENLGNEGKSLVITNSTNLTIATTNVADYKQQWYVETVADGVFTLRNLLNGKYLKSPNATSNHDWTTVETIDANCKFHCVKAGEGYSLRASNTSDGYHFMHYGAGTNDIVCWTTNDATASHWRIIETTYTTEELADRLAKVNSLLSSNIGCYKSALTNLFSDAACTTKKKSITAAQLDTDDDYLALTPTLQKMAKKVYSTSDDAWKENNFDKNKDAWSNDYAKKYRVQWYEPYTEPECAAKALRINAHTNLNNPTGIFANSGDVLFVMVEGQIKEGAYLYLASYTGHGKLSGYADGVELHEGLNVVPVIEDGTNYCINYVVKTFDATNSTGKNAIIQGRELSNYPDLQIHIEGGYINGYWNKMGDAATHKDDFKYTADTDADWDYIKERATQTDVTILGEYVTLQFPLTDAGTGDDKGMATYFNSYKDNTTSLKASIDEWDRVMIWERLLMGVVGKDVIEAEDKKSPYSDEPKVTAYTGNDDDQYGCDYGEYYRIHGLSFGTEGGYMYGSWDHCGYNFSTMNDIMLGMVNEAGPHWGPAHEIGHQHQGPLNMRGLTEVTNNLFSNVVLWYYGKSTARYNGTDGALSNVLQQFNAEGTDFFSNNIWAQTIMYYKLFLYYHVLGHNPKFYPRLFEMLRQDPMTIEYSQDGGKCLMHFYKKCCDAAGEDLTEFFRAHGFFEVMEERFVGDYSNAIYNMTQEQIDDAIAKVKAQARVKGWKENIAVLFITDATGEKIMSHREDVECLANFNGTSTCADLGCYASFNAGPPSYSYTISGNTIKMEGTGGVGFAILNEKGELIGFSDKKTFEISQDVMVALSYGEAKIVMIPSSGDPIEATSEMSESEIARTFLAELIEQAETLNALTDDEGKKVGFYKSSYVEELSTALTKAKTVFENKEASAYTPALNALKAAMDDLKSKAFAKIVMKPGTYTVRSFAYRTRYMNVNNSNEVATTTNAELTNNEKWVFEQGDGHDVYYIKNLGTGKYINALEQSKVVSATTAEVFDAKGWLVEDLGNGVFGLTCQDENNQAIHSASNNGYKIVGWNTGAEASRWYLTALETEALSEEQLALEEMISLTEDVFARVANIETVTARVELGADSYYCNAPYTSSGKDALTSYAVLYDNDYSTFLHTDYSGSDSEDGLDHYLRVDLGENNSASLFTFNYASRNSGNQNPTEITVEGCNTEDGTYELITKLTRDADKLISGGNAEYNSAVLGQSNKSYRYLRFTVTNTIQGAKKGPEGKEHIFFVFSEFGVSKATCTVTPLEKYATQTVTAEYVTEVFNKIREAKYVYVNATNATEYTEAKSFLQEYYNTLLDAYKNADANALQSKKEELQKVIDKTETLIKECGSVECTEEITPKLNITEAPYKLSDNNGASEGSLDKLYDGKQGKDYSYTSSWSDTPKEPSYLQVDLGTGNELEELIFTFTNRTEGNAPTPTEIVVSASSDGNEFTVLDTFTSAEPNWPPAANNQNITATKWTSPVIQASSACRYWRFTVTKSQRSGGGEANSNGIYHFGISEFGIVIPAGCNVTVNPEMGKVTPELLLATYDENQEAESTLNYATTEAQLDKAIAKLQAQYDALQEAVKQQLNELISTAKNLMDACGRVADNGEVTLNAPDLEHAGSVNKNMLSTLNSEIAEAEDVLGNDASTLDNYTDAITALQTQMDVVSEAKESDAKQRLETEILLMSGLLSNCTQQELIDEIEAALQAAQNTYNADDTTVEEYSKAASTLSAQRANLSAKKNLRDVIAQLEELIEECRVTGTKIVTSDVPCALQTDDEEGAFYISTNVTVSEGEIANLVDGDETTFFQTKSGVGAEHYLLVDVGAGNELQKFKFSYQSNKSPFPYAIVVYGSNEEEGEYTQLATFTKDDAKNPLPTRASQIWISSEIGTETPYRYLRFNVTKSGFALKVDGEKDIDTSKGEQLSNKYKNTLYAETPQVEYCFAMSKFALTNIVDVEQAIVYFKGDVTAAQCNYATKAKDDATTLANEECNPEVLTSTKNELQSIYDALLDASKYITVNLTRTSIERDKLLTGIEDGQTIATFSAPWSTVIPVGVTAYYATQKYDGDGGTVWLTSIEGSNILPANQGVILIGEENVKSAKFNLAEEDVDEAYLSENAFSNSAKCPVVMESNDYILAKVEGQGIGFFNAKPGSQLNQRKAFFRLPAGANVLKLVLKFGGNTTDIDTTLTDALSTDDVIYDIYGRRVTEVKKRGFYIKNGKKFFVK